MEEFEDQIYGGFLNHLFASNIEINILRRSTTCAAPTFRIYLVSNIRVRLFVKIDRNRLIPFPSTLLIHKANLKIGAEISDILYLYGRSYHTTSSAILVLQFSECFSESIRMLAMCSVR